MPKTSYQGKGYRYRTGTDNYDGMELQYVDNRAKRNKDTGKREKQPYPQALPKPPYSKKSTTYYK